MYIYIYIYILQSLPWSFGIPCEIFLFSTAPSTSLLTFETEETSAPCASAATTGSVIWIFLHLTCTYIYIYILHSLSWSFGIPCEIFLFSTAPSTSLLTFETEETSAPRASAATSGSVIRIFLHLTCTYIYIYIYILHSLSWSFGIPCEIFLGECASDFFRYCVQLKDFILVKKLSFPSKQI